MHVISKLSVYLIIPTVSEGMLSSALHANDRRAVRYPFPRRSVGTIKNVHAGRLERRVRRVCNETKPGIHGFYSFYPSGAISGVPLLRTTAPHGEKINGEAALPLFISDLCHHCRCRIFSGTHYFQCISGLLAKMCLYRLS